MKILLQKTMTKGRCLEIDAQKCVPIIQGVYPGIAHTSTQVYKM